MISRKIFIWFNSSIVKHSELTYVIHGLFTVVSVDICQEKFFETDNHEMD